MDLVAGVVAVFLAWGLGVAQLMKTWRSTEGVSTTTWAMYLVVNISWLAYAFGVFNPYLAANALGSALLTSTIVFRVAPANQRLRVVVAVAAASLTIVTIGLFGHWASLAVIVTGIAVTLRFPQIIQLIRAADTTGVSVVSWVLFTLNNVMWFVVSVQRDDIWFAGANIVMGVTSALVVILALWRQTTAPTQQQTS
jgi:uncharacterized protein with PQ loop repeat